MSRFAAITEIVGAFLAAILTALFIALDALGLIQILPGETDLQWQWWALGAFLVFCLIVMQKWYRLARQVRSALPAEVLDHHRHLMSMMDRLSETGLLTHSGKEMANWVLSPNVNESVPIPGAVAGLAGQSVIVSLLTDGLPEWDYLGQHLKKSPVWKALSEWKSSVALE